MNRHSVLLWSLCLIITNKIVAQAPFLPFKKNNLWGYIDTTGHIHVDASFEAASLYDKHGYFTVRKDHKFGIYDDSLHQVIPVQYDKVKSLSSSLLVADSVHKKCYYLPKVNYHSPVDYDNISLIDGLANYFQASIGDHIYILTTEKDTILQAKGYKVEKLEKYFTVHDRYIGLYTQQGQQILPSEYTAVAVRDTLLFVKDKEDMMGVTNSKGQIILPSQWTDATIYPYDSSKILITKNEKKGLFDLISSTHLFPAEYSDIIKTRQGNYLLKKEGYTGLADGAGNLVIPIAYHRIRYNGFDTYLTLSHKKMGLVSGDGDTLLFPKYHKIYPFVDKPFAMVRLEEKVGIINTKGQWLAKPEYDSLTITGYAVKTYKKGALSHLEISKEGDLQEVRQLKRFKTLTINTREVTEVDSGSIMLTRRRFAENRALSRVTIPSRGIDLSLVEENGFWALYDYNRARNITLPQFSYIEIDGFRKRNVVIAKHMSGRFCLINNRGKVVFNYEYKGPYDTRISKHVINFLYDTDSTYILAVIGGLYGVIDKNGELLIEPHFTKTRGNANGVFIFQSGYRWGAINLQKDTIVPFRFGNVSFLDGSDKKLFKTNEYQNLCGFANEKGQQITEVDYRQVRAYSEEIAAVKIGLRWTFVNRKGELLTKPIFDKVRDFHEGVAAVRYRNRWGFINKKGEYIIQPTFQNAGDMNGQMAPVKWEKLYGYITVDSTWEIKPTLTRGYTFKGPYAFAKKKKKYGLIDRSGKWKVSPKFHKAYATESEFRLVKGNKYLVIDKSGETLLKGKFTRLEQLEDGRYIFKSKKRKYGLLDRYGEVVVPPKYLSIKSPTQHRWKVKNVKGWGFIDSLGNEVVPCKYTRAASFHEGFAWVLDKREEKLLHLRGDELVFEGNYKLSGVSEGWITVTSSDKASYLLNIHTEEVISLDYDNAYPFKNSVAIVSNDHEAGEAYGMIDKSGTEILSLHYNKIQSIGNDYLLKLNTFYGIYSNENKELVPPDFENIELVTTNILRVEKGGKIGYLKLNGEWVWKPQK